MRTIKLRAFLSALGLLSLGCTLFAQQEGNTWEETISFVNRTKSYLDSNEGYKAYKGGTFEAGRDVDYYGRFLCYHQEVNVDNLDGKWDAKKYLPDYQITQYSNTSPYDVYTEESYTLTKNCPDSIRQAVPSMSQLIFVVSSTPKREIKDGYGRAVECSYNACLVDVEYRMEGNTIKRTTFIACYYTIDTKIVRERYALQVNVRDFVKPCEVYPFTKLKKYNGVTITGKEFLVGAKYIASFKEKNPISVVGGNIDKKIEAAEKAAEEARLAAKKAEEEARIAAASAAKIDGKYYTKEQVLQLYQKTLNKFPVLPKSRPVTTTVINGVTVKKEDTSVAIDPRPDYDGRAGIGRHEKYSNSSIVRMEVALLPVAGDKSIFKIIDTRGFPHTYSEIEQHSFGLLFPNTAGGKLSTYYVVDKNTGAVFGPDAFEWFDAKQYIINHYKPIINKRLSDELYFNTPLTIGSNESDSCYVHLGAQFYKGDDASLWQLVRILGPEIGYRLNRFVLANEKGETKTGDRESILKSFVSKDKVDYIMNNFKGVPARIFYDGKLRYDNVIIKGLVVDGGNIWFDMGENGMMIAYTPISFNLKNAKGRYVEGWVITSANAKSQEEVFNDKMNEIYRKYGKQTVMNYLSGNIKVGMSYDMMLELQKIGARLEDSYVKITDVDYYTAESGNKYIDVWLSNDTHFWIRNGVVTDVFYH